MSDETQVVATEQKAPKGAVDFEAMLAADIAGREGTTAAAYAGDDDGIEYGVDPDGGDQEEADDADDGEGSGTDVQAADDGDDRSSVEEPKRAARDERIVTRLQQTTRENVELKRRIAELEAQGPANGPARRTGDLLDDLVSMVTADLGCKADDPRVREALQRVGGDIVAELAGDIDDPGIRSRRERREQERRGREVQAQIDGLKRDREEAARQLQVQQALAAVDRGLKTIGSAEEHPYLHAGEADAVQAVWEGIMYLQRSSGLRLATDRDAEDAIAYVAKTLDDHHRSVAERLSAVGGKKSQQAPTSPTETRGSRKDGNDGRREQRGGRTVTASGVGTRAAPAPAETMTKDELWNSLLKEELSTRRRSAAQRNRNR